ncbi:MAG: helix-turn-helix domain-containing protein [Actinomycetota bacterium]|nr:helix-turn-helix domain-containing protein [Actinomycetota bacterium]
MARKDDPPRPAKGVPLPGLRELRRMRGLSQRETAERAGITQGTVWQLETGRRGAYPRTIKRLCRALRVTPEDLICGGDPER